MGKEVKQNKKYLMQRQYKEHKRKLAKMKDIQNGQGIVFQQVNLLKQQQKKKKKIQKEAMIKDKKEIKKKNKQTFKQIKSRLKFQNRFTQKLPKPIKKRQKYQHKNIIIQCLICSKQISKTNISKHMNRCHVQTFQMIKQLKKQFQTNIIICQKCMLPLNLSNLSRHYAYKHKGIPVPKRVKAYNFTPQVQSVKMPQVSNILFFVINFLLRFCKVLSFTLVQKVFNEVYSRLIDLEYIPSYIQDPADYLKKCSDEGKIHPHVLPKYIYDNSNLDWAILNYLKSNNMVEPLNFELNSYQIKKAFEFLQFYKICQINQKGDIKYNCEIQSIYNTFVLYATTQNFVQVKISSAKQYILGFHKLIVRQINSIVSQFSTGRYFNQYVQNLRSRKQSQIQQRQHQKMLNELNFESQTYQIIKQPNDNERQIYKNRLQQLYDIGRNIYKFKIENNLKNDDRVFIGYDDEFYFENKQMKSQGKGQKEELSQQNHVKYNKSWDETLQAQQLLFVVQRFRQKRQRQAMMKQDHLESKQVIQDFKLTQDEKRRIRGKNRMNKFWKC